MHENLIYEGNTIYELDPECIREKEKREKKKQDSKKRLRKDKRFTKNAIR